MLWDYIARFALAVAAGLTVCAIKCWFHERRSAMRDIHLLTLPDAAKKLGVRYRDVLRTVERDYFEGAIWIGRQRGIREEDLPKLREAIKRAGYTE